MAQYKTGSAALGALQTEHGGGGSSSEFAKFSAGTTYKVRVKGTEDIMQYFGYGVYKKVNTFVSKNPSVRNDKGFVESGHTPWDLAAKYYYDQAFAMTDGLSGDDLKAVKDSKEYKALTAEGFKYSGKERYALGFIDLATGEDIVVDFTRDQAKEVYAVITKYKAKLEKYAFELSKVGAAKASDTKVTLSPIVELDEDLSEAERKNFEASLGKPFDISKFEGLLFEADDKQQTENLVAAGFDITKIGLSIGVPATDKAGDSAKPIEGEAPPLNF